MYWVYASTKKLRIRINLDELGLGNKEENVRQGRSTGSALRTCCYMVKYILRIAERNKTPLFLKIIFNKHFNSSLRHRLASHIVFSTVSHDKLSKTLLIIAT